MSGSYDVVNCDSTLDACASEGYTIVGSVCVCVCVCVCVYVCVYVCVSRQDKLLRLLTPAVYAVRQYARFIERDDLATSLKVHGQKS